jgi:PAS domain S-box-containing protein
VLATLAALTIAGGSRSYAGTDLPEPIDSITRFWKVPALQRNLLHPVDLEFVVYYYDPGWRLLWGSSNGKEGFLPCSDVPLPLKPFQRVRLRGSVVPEIGLSGRNVEVIVLEQNVTIVPVEATDRILDTPSLKDRFVAVEGLVTQQYAQGNDHMLLQLSVGDHRVTARFMTSAKDPAPAFEGKYVRVVGVYAVPQGKPDEIELWVPAADHVVELDGDEANARADADAARLAANTPNVVRTLSEFWDMPVTNRGKPVQASLELVVYYYDPLWGLLWADSHGRPGFVECFETPLPIRNGQRVLIEGEVIPGKGIPGSRVKTTVLADNVPVPAMPVAGLIGDRRRFNQRMVVVQGVVDRAADSDAEHAAWDLISEGHSVTARMYIPPGTAAPRLDGKLVRMRGVYSPKVDPAGDLFGIDLWIPGASDIEVVGDLADDPRFQAPVTPIQQLASSQSIVRVVGTLREYDPGRRAAIRDITGQVELLTLQSQPLRIGDRIEAIGFPQTSGLRRTLNAAIMRPFRATDEESIRLTGSSVALQSTDRVLELTTDQAASGRPVQLSGLVTWSHPQADFLFVEDNSGGVCVRFDLSAGKPPSPGNAVVVSGITAAGRYAPYVTKPTFEGRGAMILPQAQLVTLEQANTGNLEARWVEMRGYVSSVEREELWYRITLTAPSGQFVARVPADTELPPIQGSVIRVRGVCEAVANERKQLVGIQLWLIGPKQIRIEAAAPEDPFKVPLQSIASLRQFSTLPALNRWVRIRATVLHHIPGDRLFVEEDGEGLLVSSHGLEPVEPGDTIEAVGLPGLESRRAVLREAVYRKIEPGAAPTATLVEQVKPFREDLDSRLVKIRGTLVSVFAQPGELLIAIEKNGAVFNAVLNDSTSTSVPAQWAPGTEIEVTGVYRIDYDERAEPNAIRLQLRSTRDVEILRPAPWWTLGRTLSIIAVLVGGVVLGLLWALSLRRRVRQQTDLIRAQLAKEANLEARNRSIVENASDFIFTTDLNGKLTAFNPAGERITGYTRDEALQMNVRELVASEEDSVRAKESMRQELGGGATFQTRLRTKDGNLIWVEISSRFLLEDGKPTGVLGIVRDISERKLFEDRLESARDAAEASARAKSAFLANMSHEIRTPMNGVIGVANLLLDTHLTQEQRDFAETIRTSAESLLSVLNDILDFSKIEAGKLQFESVPFDLAETVESAVDLLAVRAAAKRLELTAHIPPELPSQLIGDPGRLRQVLLNLLSNAVKFTERGEVVVRVRLEAADPSAVVLRFEVSDTGIGLTAEESSRLFLPFSQADNSTTRKFGGTGLGLAICKQIAELMDGTIGVQSTKGVGSTFWFTAKLNLPSPPQPTSSCGTGALSGLRVLIVDHNATSTQVLRDYLSPTGMCCETTGDGSDAITKLTSAAALARPYALVLLNYNLADTDALSWPALLAEHPNIPRPFTVLLTSVDRRFTPEELSEAKIDLTLTKPIHRAELIGALQKLFANENSANPAALHPVIPAEEREQLGRALVVEDNMVNQRVARVTLERMGFRVELAANGLEALEALERTQYDFVLMDCQMPEMDGYEATRRIRAGRHADVRIIAMTANAMEGDRERCLGAGMDDYVSKPMRVPELRAALERCHVLRPRVTLDTA